MHHHDVFFGGRRWEYAGETVKRQLDKWDMIYNPPGQVHGIINETNEDCFFQVMLGRRNVSRLRRLQAADRPDEEIRAND